MSVGTALPFGAPGLYERPDVPLRALTNVRMDICAFVGVAPRGPSRVRWNPWSVTSQSESREPRRSVARPVESWDEYRRWYGGFEGPGLLPYAVASFFEQGGRRAYVVRIVHDDAAGSAAGAGVARGAISGIWPVGAIPAQGLPLVARDEGRWGNALRASLSFRVTPVRIARAGTGVVLDAELDLPVGAVLRLHYPGQVTMLCTVTALSEDWGTSMSVRRVLRATLDVPLAAEFERAELVEGEMRIWEAQEESALQKTPRDEHHVGLGLSPQHPRWIARVLHEESSLVYPATDWLNAELVLPAADLAPLSLAGGSFQLGADRYAEIVPEDFFAARWTPADEDPADGIHALLDLSELSLLVVPDLYSPTPLPDRSNIEDGLRMAGRTFEPCVFVEPRPQVAPADALAGLRLDPRLPADRARIIQLQQRVIEIAELQRSFIALLDVPPGLSQTQIVRWRSAFSSEFAAAYHPWLQVSRPDDRRDRLIQVNPSAVAAGIIAREEEVFGVATGPANAIAEGVVQVADVVSAVRHDELHPLDINVYLRERDGIRLTAARTMAGRREYRQLSVRRLVTMIERTILLQMQWTVFEPNDDMLRNEIVRMLTGLLRALFDANAFAGATEDESFFVRCDDVLNPMPVLDAGRLIVEVGVAPAEPIEFIVLRLARQGDGVLRVQD